MKKTMIAFLLMIAANANAQQNSYTKGFKVSAGIVLAVPSSNLPLWSVGAGADVLAQYGLSKNLALTGDAGFTNLFGRKKLNGYRIIPIRAGLRYFPEKRFYLAGKAGVGFLKVKNIEGATALAYTIGGGYMFNPRLDFSAGYDGYSKNGTIGMVTLRLGYFFTSE